MRNPIQTKKNLFCLDLLIFFVFFPTPSSLRIFDIVWWRYIYQKLGCWIEEGPNKILMKGKLVFHKLISYFLLGINLR